MARENRSEEADTVWEEGGHQTLGFSVGALWILHRAHWETGAVSFQTHTSKKGEARGQSKPYCLQQRKMESGFVPPKTHHPPVYCPQNHLSQDIFGVSGTGSAAQKPLDY